MTEPPFGQQPSGQTPYGHTPYGQFGQPLASFDNTAAGWPLAAPSRARRVWPFLAVALAVLVAGGAAVALYLPREIEQAATIDGPGFVTAAPLSPFVPVPPTGGVRLSGRPSEPPDPPRTRPFRYTGTGNATVRIGSFGDDLPTLVYVKGGAQGERLFVRQIRQGGVDGATVVAHLGAYEGVRILDQDPTASWATRALRVETRGPWTIEVRPAHSAPLLRDRVTGSGDDVLRYEGSAGYATLSATGQRASVRTVGKDPSLLVTFGGDRRTGEWPAGPLLAEVNADAGWTLVIRRR